MNQFRRHWQYCQLLIAALVLFGKNNFAQTHTPRHIAINSNSKGYYEYLPEDYKESNKKHPLLLFFHGLGESGNGNEHQLKKMLDNGLPYLINEGRFPKSFRVNNQSFSFVVISPQFQQWPTNDDLDEIIDFAIKRYKVDKKRIYLTGISMGGGAVWNYTGNRRKYAKRVAAMVPICGNSWPDKTKSDTIAKSTLPVWATHNIGDPTVPVHYTNDYIAYILDLYPRQSVPVPGRHVKKTIFNSQSHDAWSATYDPGFRENGLNIFEWMLQFQRGDGVDSPLPVTLTDYKVYEDTNGEVIISWSTSMEENNAFFTIERSKDGIRFEELARINAANQSMGSRYSYIDTTAVEENNFYRLSQTDKDGSRQQFEIKKLVRTNPGKQGMLIFPNPTANQVGLRLSHEETGRVLVTIINAKGNVVGKTTYQKQGISWEQALSTSHLPPGYYILHITGKKLDLKQSFIKK